MLGDYGELAYLLAVALGVIFAYAASRKVAQPDDIPPEVGRRVRLAGLVGGVLGAYLLEIPAEVFGLSVPASRGLVAIGGRTVLGGLLGGWLAVEVAKKHMGFVGATGDRFAFPLAIAMIFGRLGCVLQGCCEGMLIAPEHPFAAVGHRIYGEPRFPATLLEGYFHAGAAVLLLLAMKKRWQRGRLLAIYLATYALVRFGLEEVRAHPEALLGLTYYQWLCVPLFLVSAGTWWRRSHRTAGIQTKHSVDGEGE